MLHHHSFILLQYLPCSLFQHRHLAATPYSVASRRCLSGCPRVPTPGTDWGRSRCCWSHHSPRTPHSQTRDNNSGPTWVSRWWTRSLSLSFGGWCPCVAWHLSSVTCRLVCHTAGSSQFLKILHMKTPPIQQGKAQTLSKSTHSADGSFVPLPCLSSVFFPRAPVASSTP